MHIKYLVVFYLYLVRFLLSLFNLYQQVTCTCNMSALQWMSCTHHLQLLPSLSFLLPCPHLMHLNYLMCLVSELKTECSFLTYKTDCKSYHILITSYFNQINVYVNFRHYNEYSLYWNMYQMRNRYEYIYSHYVPFF